LSNRLVPFLAFVLFLTLLANVFYHVFHEPPAPPGPSRTALAAACELPGATKRTVIPEGVEAVLRVALLLAAPRGDATAVGDVKDVPVTPGEMLTIPLALNRPLLPEFIGESATGTVRLSVFGPADDLAFLWFDRENLNLTARPGSGRGSGSRSLDAIRYPERWVVRRGEPLVRFGGRNPYALVFLLLDREAAAATDGGTLAFWRKCFRAAGMRPVIDRAAAAMRALRPERDGFPLPADQGVVATAMLNAALGCWLLGDLEGLDELRRRAAAEPGFLAAALGTLRHDRLDEEWPRTDPLFALQLLELLPFGGHRVQEAVAEHIGRDAHYGMALSRLRFSAPPVRAFRLLDDPVADDRAAHRLGIFLQYDGLGPTPFVDYEHDLTGDVGRYAYEHAPPADRPVVRTAWEEARAGYRMRLSGTARLRHERPAVFVAILSLMAAVALLVSLLPRGRMSRLRLTRPVIFYLYLFTVLRIADFRMSYFLPPCLLILFVLWLRSGVPHPWWERAAIFVALFSSAIHLGFQEEAAVIHPAVGGLSEASFGFAWIVIGRIVLTMPEHRDSYPFRAFLTLHVFLSVQGTAALLQGGAATVGPAVLTTLGVAVAALLWFCLEGRIGRLRSRFSGRGG